MPMFPKGPFIVLSKLKGSQSPVPEDINTPKKKPKAKGRPRKVSSFQADMMGRNKDKGDL